MATNLNYSSFDFNTIKADLISYLENDPVFKDYNFAGSNINTIIELISGVGDLFNFYINAMADESFIQSAELYQNVNKLVELTGYNPSGYKASTVSPNLSAGIDFPADDDYFEIPKWTLFSVSSTSPEGEEIKFTNPSKITFVGSAGANTYDEDVYLIQGTQDTESFTGTGNAFLKLELAELQAIEEYISVTVDGETWDYKANLVRGVDDTSNVFTTRYNKNQKIEITFGDGIFGVIPPLDSTIVVGFVKTLGEDGTIGVGEITGIDDDVFIIDGSTGNPTTTTVDFVITQSDASDGGKIPLTAEEVREYGPMSFRAQDRAVTSQDHEDLLITEFSEFILQSIVLNSDDFFTLSGESPATSGQYYNNAYLYILPNSGTTISANLQQEIFAFLEDYKMTTINYVLKNIDYRNVDTNVNFKKLETTTRSTSDIQSDIDTFVRDYFKRTNVAIGDIIKYSEILSALHEVEGISSVTLSLSSDIEAGLKYENIEFGSIQLPELNDLNITYEGTGE